MQARVAYFSMEMALAVGMKTYSGGLGVLAGDTVRGFADYELSGIGVTLLHRRGYFRQSIDENGWQQEQPDDWEPAKYAEKLPETVAITIEGRTVTIAVWRRSVEGLNGHAVPVYMLDTRLDANSEYDRTLTDYLYGGDRYYRLCQEMVLGIGGVKILRALGYTDISRFHMNEGHSAFLTLELLDEAAENAGRKQFSREDVEAIRQKCVFTTHTPVAAGHDRFPLDMAMRALQRKELRDMQDVFCCDNELNMTYLALNLSDRVNGVAKRHGEISREMFPNYEIDSITNGVHVATWTAEPFAKLFDKHVPEWRKDNFSLRYALRIPCDAVREAHQQSKQALMDYVNKTAKADFDVDTFTLGFARRATPYKRADLLMRDVQRLNALAERHGPMQIIYAGKAHPNDQQGKEYIQRVIQSAKKLSDQIQLVYLPDYAWELGGLITSGVDVWLNTPLPPNEASGTSGMKAALNGVPSLSVLDGWWLEGCIENETGWAIGRRYDQIENPDVPAEQDADSLYEKLDEVVLPLYYENYDGFLDVMINAIALNGSFFTAQRMLLEYMSMVYFR